MMNNKINTMGTALVNAVQAGNVMIKNNVITKKDHNSILKIKMDTFIKDMVKTHLNRDCYSHESDCMEVIEVDCIFTIKTYNSDNIPEIESHRQKIMCTVMNTFDGVVLYPQLLFKADSRETNHGIREVRIPAATCRVRALEILGQDF